MPVTLQGRISHTPGSTQTSLQQSPSEPARNPPPPTLLAFNDGTGGDPLSAATTILRNAGFDDGDCVEVTGDLGNIGALQTFIFTNFDNCPDAPAQP